MTVHRSYARRLSLWESAPLPLRAAALLSSGPAGVALPVEGSPPSPEHPRLASTPPATQGLAQWAGELLRRHRPAVAAVLMGATMIPALAPGTAQAELRPRLDRLHQSWGHLLRPRLSREHAPAAIWRASNHDDARARQIAQRALATAGRIPADNLFAQHNRRVLAELEKRGLPTRADGVRIFVMGENTRGREPNHGKEMVRTIAGRAGLAQGADVRMYESPDDGAMPDGRFEATVMISQAVESLIENPLYTAELVRTAQQHSAQDGRPTLVAISIGNSINDEALAAAIATIQARKGSPLYRSAQAILHRAPRERDLPRLFTYYQRTIAHALAHGPAKERLDAARAELQSVVKEARESGVLVFFAAGNSGETPAPSPPGMSSDTACVPGMVVVGATDARHRQVVSWSSECAAIALPGARVPVGPPRRNGTATTVEGTSFAGPDAAALAALMVAAGLTRPDDIERALIDPSVSHRLPGDVPGAPLITDEVAAVVRARAMVTGE